MSEGAKRGRLGVVSLSIALALVSVGFDRTTSTGGPTKLKYGSVRFSFKAPIPSAGTLAGSSSGWSKQQSAVQTFGGFSSLACPDTADCYAIGPGIIAYTHNAAGQNWVVSTIPQLHTVLQSIACSSPSRCIAVGTYYNAGAALGTTDGGATWESLTLAPNVTSLYDIACPALNDCWAIGRSLAGVPALLSTMNNGLSWAEVSVPNNMTFIDSISCPDATDCWISGRDQVNNVATMDTHDGGATWTVG